ncbi:MAG TPA: hypothetical protein VNA26_02180 [Chitinophagaceae bacterium]|nr:hypothetical protein [Chitinophagaceae bacterium]
MQKRNLQSENGKGEGRHENPTGREISDEEKKITDAAHEQAEKDMDSDIEFTAHSPNDDLDEGETARLGEEKTDLI